MTRRWPLLVIALVASLVLAMIAGPGFAQDGPTEGRESPAEIDVEAPAEELPTPLDDLDLSGELGEPADAGTVDYDDDDFAPGLFIGVVGVMIIGFIVAVVVLVVGTALLAAAIVLSVTAISVALALGLASTSTFIGVSRRSFGAGFEALLVQIGAVVGLPCGVGSAWIAYYLATTELAMDVSRNVSLVLGGLGGAAAGALLGLLTARAVRLTASWARSKLTPPRLPPANSPA